MSRSEIPESVLKKKVAAGLLENSCLRGFHVQRHPSLLPPRTRLLQLAYKEQELFFFFNAVILIFERFVLLAGYKSTWFGWAWNDRE